MRDLGFTKVGMPAQSQTGSLFPWQQPGPAPSRKIAKNFRLRDRSHFFHDFLHGLGRVDQFTKPSANGRYLRQAAIAIAGQSGHIPRALEQALG